MTDNAIVNRPFFTHVTTGVDDKRPVLQGFNVRDGGRALTQLLHGAVVILVELEVVPAGHDEVLLRVQGGRVDVGRSVYRFDQIQAARHTHTKQDWCLMSICFLRFVF